MDTKRRKELLEGYKNRMPQMGVISFLCKTTGEAFLDISKDTRAGFNSHRCKLGFNSHPNKHLQALWNPYGEVDFEISLLRELKYEDPLKDHTKELEKLRDACLEANEQASKIWK